MEIRSFYFLKHGIVADNYTDIYINNAYFSGCVPEDGILGSGYGIKVVGRSTCDISNATFTSNFVGGIYGFGYNKLKVQNCTFDKNLKYGVYAIPGSGGSAELNIRKNTFIQFSNSATNAVSQILAYRSSTPSLDSYLNTIADNTVNDGATNSNPQPTTYFHIISNLGGNDHFPILQNTMNVASGGYAMNAIYMEGNSNNFEIKGNKIANTNVVAGTFVTAALAIAVVDADAAPDFRNYVSDNTVTSILFANSNEDKTARIKCGLHLHESKNLQVCSNELDGCVRGAHFEGDLHYCDFAKNNINDHYYGIFCQKTALNDVEMGHQRWHKNLWKGGYAGYGAKYDGNASPPSFKFWVEPGTQERPPTINVPDWFIDDHQDEWELDNSACVTGSIPPNGVSDGEHLVALGTYPFPNSTVEWDLKRRLLVRLMLYPALRPAGSAEATFYANMNGTSPWNHALAEKYQVEAFSSMPDYTSAITARRSAMKTLLDEIRILDSLEAIDMNTIDPALQQQRAAKSLQSLNHGAVIDSLESITSAYIATQLNQAESYNNGLSVSTAWETNTRFFRQLALKEAKGDTLTTAELNELRALCQKCPRLEGDVIRQAPRYLPHEESRPYWNENYWSGCGQQQSKSYLPNATQPLVTEGIAIAPNPVRDRLWVQFSSELLENETTLTWQIFDVKGAKLNDGTWQPSEGEQLVIDVYSLLPGVYFFQTQSGIQKFIKL